MNITANQFNTRADDYLNDKNTIFGRYSYAAFTEQSPGAFGSVAGGPSFANYSGNSQALNESLAIGWTYTISPTVINEFRFGWMRYHVFDVPNGYGTQPALQAGIPGLNLDKTYTSGCRHSISPLRVTRRARIRIRREPMQLPVDPDGTAVSSSSIT